MPRHRKAILALVAANLIWGAASPIFKFALQNIPPFTLAFIRFYGASLILLAMTYPYIKFERRDWLKLFLLSVFGVTLHISFYFMGLKLAPSINAPVISATGPIIIYILSIYLLREKPKFKILSGIIISLTGVLVIIGQPFAAGHQNGQLTGNLFLFLAVLGAVGHAVISKEIHTNYSAGAITFWMCIIGAITFMPLAAYELYSFDIIKSLDLRGVVGILYGIFFSSAAAYTLFEYGVRNLKGQDIGIFTYLDLVAAILVALPLLGEKITPVYFLGSILVFIGILFAEGNFKHHPHHRFHKR
ncbi:MAG: hypothetical protein UV73_C0007G0074 [Candidatus Gottesmanbacteria bacterium GW2011_GWA2_43_14]|uniref:EamA domain-containing protein n=1 Tax=Candidatus Gottesmanbacteria bacterium GW2011_GWA2_43_14 TaxID=1618443 RepID=A0A0G1FRI8_9BACT|nr:MAG: hypothetical protein UV73_C0007G0074 [Candidatus Gottesmanbacteria bacterium GW2011_GWA2_43_14]